MGSFRTTIGCIAESENTMRIARRAVDPGDSSQSSLTLDPSVISTGFQNDGQDNITSAGQGLFSNTIPSAEDLARIDLSKRRREQNFD